MSDTADHIRRIASEFTRDVTELDEAAKVELAFVEALLAVKLARSRLEKDRSVPWK